MTPLRRIAFIGNSLPPHFAIATFTTDLRQAISPSRPVLETAIVAMTDRGRTYDYPASVAMQIKDDNIDDYIRAAEFLNAGRFDAAGGEFEAARKTEISQQIAVQMPPSLRMGNTSASSKAKNMNLRSQ